MAQNCLACQQAKVSRHTKSHLDSFEVPSQRFTNIHLDIIGPLPLSDNQRYCVTLIDRYTRWPEAIPIPDITAPTVAFAVYSGWIARFGVPESIVTDQGSQFESHLFAELSKLLGFEHKRTTSYNPKCNGIIERWHRTLKSSLMCYNRPDWTQFLPSILLGLRATFKDDIQSSAAELVYGESLRLPGQFLSIHKDSVPQSELIKSLKNHFDEIRPTPTARHSAEKIFVHKELNSCSHVFVRTDSVRKSLQPPYKGPYLVLKRYEKFFDVDLNGKSAKISIDRLKPVFNENLDTHLPTSSSEDNTETKPKSKKKVTFNLTPKVYPIYDNPTTRSGRTVKTPLRLLQSLESSRRIDEIFSLLST